MEPALAGNEPADGEKGHQGAAAVGHGDHQRAAQREDQEDREIDTGGQRHDAAATAELVQQPHDKRQGNCVGDHAKCEEIDVGLRDQRRRQVVEIELVVRHQELADLDARGERLGFPKRVWHEEKQTARQLVAIAQAVAVHHLDDRGDVGPCVVVQIKEVREIQPRIEDLRRLPCRQVGVREDRQQRKEDAGQKHERRHQAARRAGEPRHQHQQQAQVDRPDGVALLDQRILRDQHTGQHEQRDQQPERLAQQLAPLHVDQHQQHRHRHEAEVLLHQKVLRRGFDHFRLRAQVDGLPGQHCGHCRHAQQHERARRIQAQRAHERGRTWPTRARPMLGAPLHVVPRGNVGHHEQRAEQVGAHRQAFLERGRVDHMPFVIGALHGGGYDEKQRLEEQHARVRQRWDAFPHVQQPVDDDHRGQHQGRQQQHRRVHMRYRMAVADDQQQRARQQGVPYEVALQTHVGLPGVAWLVRTARLAWPALPARR